MKDQKEAKNKKSTRIKGKENSSQTDRNELLAEEILSEKEIAYFKKYNEERLLILNIESRFAADHIDELLDMPDIRYCPHGRPVAVTLTKKELDKMFKRIV